MTELTELKPEINRMLVEIEAVYTRYTGIEIDHEIMFGWLVKMRYMELQSDGVL